MQTIDAAEIEQETPVVIIGGSNDSLNNNLGELYEHLEAKLIHASKNRPVFLTSIPIRYDKPLNHPVNTDLKAMNNYIFELTARMNNVHFISMDGFERVDHTKHGLHLSKRGKVRLAHAIVQSVTVWYNKTEVQVLSLQGKNQSQPIIVPGDVSYAETVKGGGDQATCDTRKQLEDVTVNFQPGLPSNSSIPSQSISYQPQCEDVFSVVNDALTLGETSKQSGGRDLSARITESVFSHSPSQSPAFSLNLPQMELEKKS